MNKINRSIVKLQAKEIIRGKVFPLFLVVLIVTMLTSGTSIVVNINNISKNIKAGNYFNSSDSDSYSFDNDFGKSFGDDFGFDYDNPIENFEFNSSNNNVEVVPVSDASNMRIPYTGSAFNGLSLVNIVFMPLLVTMSGMFLSLVRRNKEESFQLGNELGALFKKSFNDTYLKKLAGVLVRSLLTGLLAVLFIVPGVIYWYSTYFTYEIMADNPNMNFNDAINLSKKMVKGNRTELFVLDLSFIGWYLLCIITLGLGLIYVYPYVCTTKALYYENFRLRALQEGRITEADFLTYNDRVNAYRQQGAPQSGNGNNYYSYTNYNNGANTNNYYYNPQPPQGNANEYSYVPKAEQPQSTDNNFGGNSYSYPKNNSDNYSSMNQNKSDNDSGAQYTENSENDAE